jgi:tRNA U55 pseudouridine synthase TruB
VKIVVMHSGKGCDTGCCGHVIEIDGTRSGEFHYDHPDSVEEARAFAEQLVTAKLGAEHVADLDWDNCEVRPDNDGHW